MPKLCDVKAVCLDAVGTVMAPHPSVGQVYASVAAEWGYEASPASLEAAFRAVYKERL
ncbi:MAG: hypothetical protein ISS72_04905, partial [Candidatus Brocadiae bacterium]|nr:hypothetical protein [Candidatus Brocadiia bacterium]